ncbi:MAG: hypothetical protein ABFC63_06250 [Thermoguttaceae bacterium]
MAKLEGDDLNFDDLAPLDADVGDELFAADAMPAETAAEKTPAPESPPEAPPAEEQAAEVAKPEEAVKEDAEEETEPSKLPLILEVVALVVIPLGLLALASRDIVGSGLGLLSVWTALYLIGLGLIPYALWRARETSTLYTLFLGCVLAAMLTGVYCLWMELAVNYQFDIHAQEAKRKVGMILPAERGLPSPLSIPAIEAAPAGLV